MTLEPLRHLGQCEQVLPCSVYLLAAFALHTDFPLLVRLQAPAPATGASLGGFSEAGNLRVPLTTVNDDYITDSSDYDPVDGCELHSFLLYFVLLCSILPW
jgi:hypothetical protein